MAPNNEHLNRNDCSTTVPKPTSEVEIEKYMGIKSSCFHEYPLCNQMIIS